jgi:hypothetical protein
MSLSQQLRQIDYRSLPISDYSRDYILRLLPILDYYLDICNQALDYLLPATRSQLPATLIDYGGGHGFMSLLAKRRGIRRVIYVDYNPQAAETITALSHLLGQGPDVILTGDQDTLRDWCREHQVVPDALVGIDVIEHIYRLDLFFDGLKALNPHMAMVFSTSSTPFNPWVKRRLRRFMERDEQGHDGKPGFYQLRRDFIARLRPDLSPQELDCLARQTRGLAFQDINSECVNALMRECASLNSQFSILNSQFSIPNTCDPRTGSWTERILPIEAYRRYARHCHVTYAKGFYNRHHQGLKGLAARTLNLLLRLPFTRWIAPFIYLKVNP